MAEKIFSLDFRLNVIAILRLHTHNILSVFKSTFITSFHLLCCAVLGSFRVFSSVWFSNFDFLFFFFSITKLKYCTRIAISADREKKT